jgi:hypothetical protein
VAVEAGFPRQRDVCGAAVAGDGDEPHLVAAAPGMRFPPKLARDLVPVQPGKADVHKHHVRTPLPRDTESVGAGVRGTHDVALLTERTAQHQHQICVVIHHQDPQTIGLRLGRFGFIGRGPVRRRDDRQPHDELTSLDLGLALGRARRAVRFDASAVQFDQTMSQRQPDAQPAVRTVEGAVGLGEEVEDAPAAQHALVDHHAVVAADHMWCRWDDGTKRFNLEATSTKSGTGEGSFSTPPDEAYQTDFNIPAKAVEVGSDMTTLTARQTLGVYLQQRSAYYRETGKWAEAEEDLLLARVCFPENRDIFRNLLMTMDERAKRLYTSEEWGRLSGRGEDPVVAQARRRADQERLLRETLEANRTNRETQRRREQDREPPW